MNFDYGILPLANFRNQQETEETLSALFSGGLKTVEIACRTPYALEAIALAARKFKGMCIGAGTVLNGEQAKQVLDMGATFLVSPGLSEEIARIAEKNGVPYFPGCVTPTEIMQALSLGITTVKFFPAEIYGGIKALRALSEPFKSVKFLPTGGITMETFQDYLALDSVVAAGGSFVFKGNVEENCAKIRALGRKS